MGNEEFKICKECSFEARNGHANGCSHRDKEYRCPKCFETNGGTLSILNWEEERRLSKKIKRELPNCVLFGCDECRFWATIFDVEDLTEV
jgi:hypothetical protein